MSRSPNAKRLVPCMPPLLNEEKLIMSTSYSGKSCEELVKYHLLLNGINVSVPYVDEGADILVEKGFSNWVRGQIKKVTYKNELDQRMYKRSGKKVYRDIFSFRFQSGSDRIQRTPKDVDYFYSALITPLRSLIWEIPSNLINLRKNGSFVESTKAVIDRDSWITCQRKINLNDSLIHSYYDPRIFKAYPEFFLNEIPTLEDYFS